MLVTNEHGDRYENRRRRGDEDTSILDQHEVSSVTSQDQGEVKVIG